MEATLVEPYTKRKPALFDEITKGDYFHPLLLYFRDKKLQEEFDSLQTQVRGIF